MSSYTIAVKLDNEPDEIFLIHGYTGAIDLIATSIVLFLEEHETFEKSEIPCSEATQHALEKRGYITQKTAEEEHSYVHHMAEVLFKKENLLNNSFTFAVTYDCNFRCPYCFEKGIQKDKTTFTKEMTDKAYQAIMQIAPNEKFRSKTISLYGGEPLLKENKEAVSYIVQKGKEFGFKFFAVTNGYDLDCYEDLLSPDKISGVQITIDGLLERHNSRRIHYQGYPTFDKIVDNIGLALRKGINVAIRVNTDADNISDLQGLQSIFTKLHYTESESFFMESALLKNYSDKVDGSYQYLSQKDFFMEYKKLGLKYNCQDYGTFRKIASAIQIGKPLSFRSTYCGAQSGGYVLDPFGNIYACWETVNNKLHCLGNYSVAENIIWNQTVLNAWRKTYIMDRCTCQKCKYALICSGGCAAQSLNNYHCAKMEDVVQYAVNRTYVSLK